MVCSQLQARPTTADSEQPSNARHGYPLPRMLTRWLQRHGRAVAAAPPGLRLHQAKVLEESALLLPLLLEVPAREGARGSQYIIARQHMRNAWTAGQAIGIRYCSCTNELSVKAPHSGGRHSLAHLLGGDQAAGGPGGRRLEAPHRQVGRRPGDHPRPQHAVVPVSRGSRRVAPGGGHG